MLNEKSFFFPCPSRMTSTYSIRDHCTKDKEKNTSIYISAYYAVKRVTSIQNMTN